MTCGAVVVPPTCRAPSTRPERRSRAGSWNWSRNAQSPSSTTSSRSRAASGQKSRGATPGCDHGAPAADPPELAAQDDVVQGNGALAQRAAHRERVDVGEREIGVGQRAVRLHDGAFRCPGDPRPRGDHAADAPGLRHEGMQEPHVELREDDVGVEPLSGGVLQLAGQHALVRLEVQRRDLQVAGRRVGFDGAGGQPGVAPEVDAQIVDAHARARVVHDRAAGEREQRVAAARHEGIDEGLRGGAAPAQRVGAELDAPEHQAAAIERRLDGPVLPQHVAGIHRRLAVAERERAERDVAESELAAEVQIVERAPQSCPAPRRCRAARGNPSLAAGPPGRRP